jgi:tetratricopeptide (TPR) repeat protein
LKDYELALQDLDKADFLEPNNTFILQSHGDVKNMLKDYQETLENLNKANFFEPNNAFILRNYGNVKKMLKDYQGALEDLHKANVLEPNNAFTLQSCAMHSFCDVAKMSKDIEGLSRSFGRPSQG